MLNKKIIICSTVKNEERNLIKHFKILDNLVKNFSNSFLIFVISDSNDKSQKLCENYLRKNKGIVIIKNFNNKHNRIKKLEVSRNLYLNYIKRNRKINYFDYLIVMDVDKVNNLINFNKIKNSLKKKKWNAIFANQKIFYYDIFALRIKNFIEFNFIEKIKREYFKNNEINLKNLFKENLFKFFFLNKFKKERFIQVKSAFGGFAIYNLKKILKLKYKSLNGKYCEHVSLNLELDKKYGNLFIDRKLINSSGINTHTINGILCAYINYFAKRFLYKIIK
jgi:hypothetical protein